MSAIGAFVFGFSLGYSSPTMAGNIAGQNKTLCVLPGSGSADGSHNETKPNNPVVRPNNPETDGMMNCDLWLSDDMVTWFGSLINLGCLGGALLGGKFVDLVGKKHAMTTSFVLYTIGWLLIAWGCPHKKDITVQDQTNVEVMLIMSRVIVGAAIGVICCSVANYQTELCTTEIRGAIGTVFQLAITCAFSPCSPAASSPA